MILSRTLPLLLLPTMEILIIAETDKFSRCDPKEYYSPVSEKFEDYNTMHELLRSTHRNFLKYTDRNRDDVWKALIDIDGKEEENNNIVIQPIYNNTTRPTFPYGTSDTWNREHVWPKSRGVGKTGPDFTDLHHLRPSDANVNSARGNKLFGSCGLVRDGSECQKPAHREASLDTEADSEIWLPPANVRGDVARSLMYMAVRYDGTGRFGDNEGVDLVLTDCPLGDYDVAQLTYGVGEMAYLTQLLEWHEMDPVDQEELMRNDRVCRRWQGNRNPFVDFPELAVPYFHSQTRPFLGAGLGYDCPPREDGEEDSEVDDECNGITEGDIAIVGFTSDNPDTVVLVALSDIAPGSKIHMTDNAWTGSSFLSNEGTIQVTISNQDGLAAGSIFGFSSDGQLSKHLPYSNQWTPASGRSFALSTLSDSIIIYCIAKNQNIHGHGFIQHLTALTYSPDGWSQPTNDQNYFTSANSAKPQSLPSESALELPHMDNYRYVGSKSGTRNQLLQSIGSAQNWLGSNTRFEFDHEILDGFSVVGVGMEGSSATEEL